MDSNNGQSAAAEDPAASKGKPPVAICLDDDPLVGAVFLAAAARAGAAGIFTAEPREFERAVASHAPRVVVLDQMMPDRTGAETILWLRGLESRPRLIAISADALYLETAAALIKGAGLDLVAALRKPLRVNELAEAIRSAVAG